MAQPAQQKILVDTWAEMVDKFRDEANAAQAKAAETMAANGIKVVVADKADLAAARTRMLSTEGELVKELKLDPAIVAKVNAAVGAAK